MSYSYTSDRGSFISPVAQMRLNKEDAQYNGAYINPIYMAICRKKLSALNWVLRTQLKYRHWADHSIALHHHFFIFPPSRRNEETQYAMSYSYTSGKGSFITPVAQMRLNKEDAQDLNYCSIKETAKNSLLLIMIRLRIDSDIFSGQKMKILYLRYGHHG